MTAKAFRSHALHIHLVSHQNRLGGSIGSPALISLTQVRRIEYTETYGYNESLGPWVATVS